MMTTHFSRNLEQASSSPGDVPVAYSFVFQRSVSRLSHGTDHEHSIVAIIVEIVGGIVPSGHFQNGNERSVYSGPRAFLWEDTLQDHRCHWTVVDVSFLVSLADSEVSCAIVDN